MEVGYLESIEIPKLGKMIAKFDTGNGSTASSIHADAMEEKDGVLYWSIGENNFEDKIVGYTKTEVGRDTEERPIIKLDIIFNGVKIPGVKVAPTSREQKSTPFLANRVLMKKLGVMVNPHKAFVSSEPMNGYKPMEAKGNPYGGIDFSPSDI